MKAIHILSSAVVAAAIAATVIANRGQAAGDQGGQLPERPASATEAAGPIGLLSAQAFRLTESATHDWRLERPSYDEGLLLVLDVQPDLVAPRQLAEPVLVVGDQTAERVNVGYPGRNLVVIVPGLTLEALADAPLFFGAPALPEQVDAAWIAAQRDEAVAAGARAVGGARVAEVTRDPIESLDLGDLHFAASFLVERYAPQEVDLVQGLRVPRLDLK